MFRVGIDFNTCSAGIYSLRRGVTLQHVRTYACEGGFQRKYRVVHRGIITQFAAFIILMMSSTFGTSVALNPASFGSPFCL